MHRKSPPTVTAEIARHDEKTSVGRAKVLSGGDTGYSLNTDSEISMAETCFMMTTDHLI